MDIVVRSIKLPFTCSDEEFIEKAKKKVERIIPHKYVGEGSIYKKSVDAREKNNICFVCSIRITIKEEYCVNKEELERNDCTLLENSSLLIEYGNKTMESRPVIVGFGPAGMYCAMILAENGYKPIVLERGYDVENRKKAVEQFVNTGKLDTTCNIQFGAGGAGTFSDGKLITRINDTKCRYVLEKFVQFGAPKEILEKSKPHIGTDRLLSVVDKIEKYITSLGGSVIYGTTVLSFNRQNNVISSVRTTSGDFPCSLVVLAIGHSARDTYSYLLSQNYSLSGKPFSVGVRIEHLQTEIDKAMYGRFAGDPRLGHAEYSLSKRTNGRGVYTFCMCPGGEVVAAASEEGRLVTNGMSKFARDGVNANSAIVVDVKPESPMQFQRILEERAFAAGGGNYCAPIETVGDFLNGTVKNDPSIVQPTYMKGNHYKVADLTSIFPSDIDSMLKQGIEEFGRKIKGFDCEYAVLTGVETRTSAPYRINRNESKISVDAGNLYPCGEGAGFAGGITSAAVDGIAVALEIMKEYKPME